MFRNVTFSRKFIISGPVRCVNKILMLESKNIKLLGGEVQGLCIENAYENVLLRKINQQKNLNPKTDYSGMKIVPDVISIANSKRSGFFQNQWSMSKLNYPEVFQ